MCSIMYSNVEFESLFIHFEHHTLISFSWILNDDYIRVDPLITFFLSLSNFDGRIINYICIYIVIHKLLDS